MSKRPETRSDEEKEFLDLYMKADPDTQKAFVAALKGEKLNAADVMSMLSGIMNDPNVSALFQSMKKMFGNGNKTNGDKVQQLLAFTFFYSSSIYALLLGFLYWNWNNDEKAEQPEESDDHEQ